MTLYEFDQEYKERYGLVCGTDEAGRGPLAGDVYAAAVIFPEGVVIDGLNDSKKLTEKKREELFDEIREKALAWCIASSSVAEIEEMNILEAAKLAMKRAVAGLGETPGIILVDGNMPPKFDTPYEAVVKGDGKSQAVAAASVLAKVERDRYMKRLDEQYPDWQFAKHKGYGTKLHYEMIDKFGESPVHRPSFLRKYYAKKAGGKHE
ncbi:MAG: ribonuclease HII [Ruminococcus sp.]|nr:ribonuclease HII [Ruminococcus sp.]